MTENDNEWQQIRTIGTTNENKWKQVKQSKFKFKKTKQKTNIIPIIFKWYQTNIYSVIYRSHKLGSLLRIFSI